MKPVLIAALLIIANIFSVAQAAADRPTVLFVPHDNRPVSFRYTVETLEAAGVNIVTPAAGILGGRNQSGDCGAIEGWLLENAMAADAAVISADMLLYGGLVSSRRHNFSSEIIAGRIEVLKKIKEINPSIRIYIFTSIMRSPKFSAGGVEPDYYEQYGPSIFRITALEDKKELGLLPAIEQLELNAARKVLPQAIMADWQLRRDKNLQANLALIHLTRQEFIDFLALGRDDNAPFSQTHRENRILVKAAAGLPETKYQSLAGVDEMGLVLLTRAVNDSRFQIPTTVVRYAPGKGPETIPAYSDEEIGKSVNAHLTAAGVIPLLTPEIADFTLLINTDEKGITHEANSPENLHKASFAAAQLAQEAQQLAQKKNKIAVADVAFANGADNGFMSELEKRGLISKMIAYSGWNTPNNSVGYVIGQGVLGLGMSDKDRKKLIAVRLLDDWGYQANIRQQLVSEVLIPNQGNYFYLNELESILSRSAQQNIKKFAVTHLQEFNFEDIHVGFPWNRMFELDVEVAIKN